MPYKIKPQGGKFCVVNTENTKTVNCHDSKPKAVRQMRALYANEKAELAHDHPSYSLYPCLDEACERAFLDLDLMLEHAERVHDEGDEARTFSTEERKQAAKKGQAQSGGGFPIKSVQDLKNAIQAFGRAKNKAATKAHIIKRAKALNATNLLPKGWLSDKAEVSCPEDDCARAFRDEDRLAEHAEAVHTFHDIERQVRDAVRDEWGRQGDYRTGVSWIHAWVMDLSTDWCVFELEKEGDTTLYKVSYTIADNKVTFGEPVEVVRRTVYEPVKKSEDD